MIEIIGTKLYQWDTGRSVLVKDSEADHVHFANKGDSKAVIMEIADSQAKIPDYLFQTGKQLCAYAVKNGITIESYIFYVAPRERPENYVYDEDQRNYIYELISKAETAIEGAHTAYEDAHLAVEAANAAVDNANTAVENANKSADSANLAAKNANEAADKANHTAKSLMVVGSAEGESISLYDAIDQFVVGLRVFGKTTQDGTPTPEAPVELESVGHPIVMVNNQTLDLDYILRGIPVASGGNYTDANGQQWICDEIDLASGMYVQRIGRKMIDSSATFTRQKDTHTVVLNMFTACGTWGVSSEYGQKSLFCTIAAAGEAGSPNDKTANVCQFNGTFVNFLIDVSLTEFKELDEFSAYVAENPFYVYYILEDPIATPLSEEMLAAFAALRTYRGNTTVSNDASAHMEIEYVMDAKKYIDSQIHPAAKLSSISLPASKWTGSDNLYSQVVTIPGITENSQVNLAPSVEQMAIFYEKDITFVTENDGGVVTVYVIGQKPQNDYTIQADIVEVIV